MATRWINYYIPDPVNSTRDAIMAQTPAILALLGGRGIAAAAPAARTAPVATGSPTGAAPVVQRPAPVVQAAPTVQAAPELYQAPTPDSLNVLGQMFRSPTPAPVFGTVTPAPVNGAVTPAPAPISLGETGVEGLGSTAPYPETGKNAEWDDYVNAGMIGAGTGGVMWGAKNIWDSIREALSPTPPTPEPTVAPEPTRSTPKKQMSWEKISIKPGAKKTAKLLLKRFPAFAAIGGLSALWAAAPAAAAEYQATGTLSSETLATLAAKLMDMTGLPATEALEISHSLKDNPEAWADYMKYFTPVY